MKNVQLNLFDASIDFSPANSERGHQLERMNKLDHNVMPSIRKLLSIFNDGYLNPSLEFVIFHPFEGKYCNIYFNAGTCKTELDVKRKVLEWWSRDAYKTKFYYPKFDNQVYERLLNGINTFLDTNFDKNQIEIIYSKLGNACNSSLCEEFIKSGYDFTLLEKK